MDNKPVPKLPDPESNVDRDKRVKREKLEQSIADKKKLLDKIVRK